jgi:hypothetical protein
VTLALLCAAEARNSNDAAAADDIAARGGEKEV